MKTLSRVHSWLFIACSDSCRIYWDNRYISLRNLDLLNLHSQSFFTISMKRSFRVPRFLLSVRLRPSSTKVSILTPRSSKPWTELSHTSKACPRLGFYQIKHGHRSRESREDLDFPYGQTSREEDHISLSEPSTVNISLFSSRLHQVLQSWIIFEA